MSEKQFIKLQIKRGPTEVWENENFSPVLDEGELGLNTTTGQLKIGTQDNQTFNEAKDIGSNINSNTGNNVIISGEYANAEGDSTRAIGFASHAEGIETYSIGNVSHTEGYKTFAYGDNSHAEGVVNINKKIILDQESENKLTDNKYQYTHTSPTSLRGQTVVGQSLYGPFEDNQDLATILDYDYQTNIITLNKKLNSTNDILIDTFLVSCGTFGSASHAEGLNATTYGNNSHAEGFNTIAYGDNSHAEGNNTITGLIENNIEKIAQHAEGYGGIAIGRASHVEGGFQGIHVINCFYDVTGEANVTTYNYSNSNSVTIEDKIFYNKKLYNIINLDTENKNFTLEQTLDSENNVNIEMLEVLTHHYAFGDYSHAEGHLTQAIGTGSHAEGGEFNENGIIIPLLAKGDYSHAEGIGTLADRRACHAEGNRTEALGVCSHAEGDQTKAIGDYSHSEGAATQAIGKYSHAENANTIASGIYSHAEGSNTESLGSSSHAEGNRVLASSNYSHAEGNNTTSSGESAHAEGWQTTASGKSSHAEGALTTASGAYSHVEGYQSQAIGIGAHATGGQTEAKNTYSSTFGQFTIASGNCQTVIGKYNEENSAKAYFIVGKGSPNSRSNAFRVDNDGNIYSQNSQNTSGADYAEYFEWEDLNFNNEDRRGYFVTLNEDKIKIAKSNDYILGVISALPAIIGNSDESWRGRYIYDEFGAFIPEEYEYEVEKWNEETQEIETITEVGVKFKENPEYDPSQVYIPRADRPEWDAVGMMGVLAVRDDGTCQVNGYCSVTDKGIATASEIGYRVIKRVNDNIVKIIFR